MQIETFLQGIAIETTLTFKILSNRKGFIILSKTKIKP